MDKKGNVLIIDKDQTTIGAIESILHGLNYYCVTAHSGEEALDILCYQEHVDIVLLDQQIPGISGESTLIKLKDLRKDFLVIMMVVDADVARVDETAKMGAYDYLSKPIKKMRLKLLLERAMKHKEQKREVTWPISIEANAIDAANGFVTQDKYMLQMLMKVQKIAKLDSAVAITGESGTGKELIARMIHDNSPRANGPFIAINCAALTEELLGSSLFGFERGAFTGAIKKTAGCFEEAYGGTLFLDEVSDMSPKLQSSLLRVLQEKEFCSIGSFDPIPTNVRFLTATNKNLENEVKAKKFREDLFYRLNVIPVYLSPLRERKSDIPLLLTYFLKKLNDRMNANINACSVEAMEMLFNWEWPGNCREFQNLLEYIIAIKQNGQIEIDDFPSKYHSHINNNINKDEAPEELRAYSIEKRAFEKRYLLRALSECEGNIIKMSKVTKIPRSNLYMKLANYNLK